MINAIIGSVFDPAKTFQKEMKNANWSVSLGLYIISFFITLFLAFIFHIYLPTPETARTVGYLAFQTLFGTIIFLWIFSHISKRLGGHGNFLKLYYLSSLWILPFTLFTIFLLFTAPYWGNFGLEIIPIIFYVILTVWELLIFFIAIREVTKLTPSKAVLGLVIATVILFIVLIVFALALLTLLSI